MVPAAWLFALTTLGSAVMVAGPSPKEAQWEGVGAPPPTPWAVAGARGWRLCHDAEEQALAARRGGPGGGPVGTDSQLWARRAAQCPHSPHVLAVAAEQIIIDAAGVLAGVENWDREGDKLGEVIAEHRKNMRRALRWLDAAIAESERRGELPPSEAYYYRAYALTTLGEVDKAQRAIEVAAEHRDVAAHRIQRMAALIRLFSGDLEAALRLGHRAVVDAPANADRMISRFIYVLILDRAGASNAAATELQALHREGGRLGSREAVESVLPMHERLFLRALDHQANEQESHAIRVWELYLGREEPEAPERVLARRHLDELEPRPEAVNPLQ